MHISCAQEEIISLTKESKLGMNTVSELLDR